MIETNFTKKEEILQDQRTPLTYGMHEVQDSFLLREERNWQQQMNLRPVSCMQKLGQSNLTFHKALMITDKFLETLIIYYVRRLDKMEKNIAAVQFWLRVKAHDRKRRREARQ